MNVFKLSLITAAIVIAGVVGVGAQPVSAANKLCTLEGLKLNEYKKSFTINGDNVTAKFTLKGDKDCKFDMTLFTFETPAAEGTPEFFKSQKLYSYQTGSFGPGTHTLTTTMPQCKYQLDLVTGKPISAEKGETLFNVVNLTNMTNQGQIGGTNNINAHTHDALIGGDKACEEPEQPEVCPYDETMKKDDPNCKESEEPCPYDKTMDKDDKDCVKPEQPAEGGPETPTTLPRTGATAAIFGFGSIAAAVRQLIVSRRSLIKASLLKR